MCNARTIIAKCQYIVRSEDFCHSCPQINAVLAAAHSDAEFLAGLQVYIPLQSISSFKKCGLVNKCPAGPAGPGLVKPAEKVIAGQSAHITSSIFTHNVLPFPFNKTDPVP